MEDKSAFMMKLDATGVTLADLLLSGVRAQLSISGDLLSFSIPELRLRHSAVSLDATYNLKNGQGLMNFAAPDFEISELNSTLIPRLMHGRLSAQAELRAAPGENPPWERLTGTVSLSGSELIIAQLGLDLINGGSADTRNLSFDELIDGLRGADLGAREARLEANFTPAQVNASAEMNLSTARLKAQLRADLRKFTLKGHLNLMSLRCAFPLSP